MPDRMINVTVVETVHYYRTVTLRDLEAAAGMTHYQAEGSLNRLLAAAQERAASGDEFAMAFAEDLERHGDVQGQTWSGTWAGG